MKIKDIGGEFELIKRISRPHTDPKVIKSIGDDCAVIDNHSNKDMFILVTTDMMVENDHFPFDWQTPEQIGKKLMEVNVSDIVAMGGTPKYAFISMVLTKNSEVEMIDGFYKGLYASGEKHGVIVIGGDTTHGNEHVFNLTLIGEVDKQLVRYRSGAKVGDKICVTGNLGRSTAGLKVLLKKPKTISENNKRSIEDHNNPLSRTVQEGRTIAKFANSLIDVSDGLASEIKHIADESKTGAKIFYENIPISNSTKNTAKDLGENPNDYALYGGEDFELVFTIDKENIKSLKESFKDFCIVGEIIDISEGVYILKDGKKQKPQSGYDHFAT